MLWHAVAFSGSTFNMAIVHPIKFVFQVLSVIIRMRNYRAALESWCKKVVATRFVVQVMIDFTVCLPFCSRCTSTS